MQTRKILKRFTHGIFRRSRLSPLPSSQYIPLTPQSTRFAAHQHPQITTVWLLRRQTVGLDSLPAELITQIVVQSSDAALKSLGATSRSLREKSFHTYGNRFFQALKFCLYPNSLQALIDISYTPLLARYIQCVAIGTEDVGLLDPIHDGDYQQGKAQHTTRSQNKTSGDDLLQVRMRADSAVISQALMKLPNLKQVVIGDRFCFNGKTLRSSIGANQLRPIVCPTGHCTTMLGSKWVLIAYHTVVLALHQIADQLNNNI